LLGFPIAVDIETPARFHTSECTDRSGFNAVLKRDRLGDLFLIVPAAGKVYDRPVGRLHPLQRYGLDLLARLLNMGSKVFEPNLVGPQIPLQTEWIGDLSQRASQHQTIEAIENAGDLAGIFCGKLVPAFLPYESVFG
jgi:hypothetical protein